MSCQIPAILLPAGKNKVKGTVQKLLREVLLESLKKTGKVKDAPLVSAAYSWS